MQTTLNYAEDQFINIDNLRIRYRCLGRGNHTLLFLHGLTASLEHWYKLIPELVQHYKIITVDLPGCGCSVKPRVTYSVDFYMRFLRNFVTTMKLNDFALIGHSFGGGLALKFALTYPRVVNRLVLLNNAGFCQRLNILLRLLTIPGLRGLLTLANRDAVALGLKMVVYDNSLIEAHFVDRVYEIFRSPGFYHAFFSTLEQSANFFGIKPAIYQSISDALLNLRVPTLVFWGDNDPILPFKWQQQSLKQLPCAKIQILPQCGHLSYLEHPKTVAQAIKYFIAN